MDHAAGWKLALIGLTAGVLGGGLGIGGGIILVPLLVLIGLDRHRAHATSLGGIVFIAAAGAASFAVSGEADVAAGVLVGIGGVLGSVIGASVMHRVSARALRVSFTAVLVIVGIRMIVDADPLAVTSALGAVAEAGIAIAIGLIAGFFAGLVGIGGGVVIVPSSIFLLGLDQHQAQGTSLIAIIFTATAGSLVNLRNERVRLVDGLSVGLGGALGSIAGSRLALGLEADSLARFFGLFVLVVAVRSLYRLWREPGSSTAPAS